MASLLQLPRELRDIIYDYYVQCDGGYVYNAETQRLSQADSSPICYALALTCRQVSSELEGLAFQSNPITFSASRLRSAKQAGIHHAVVAMLASKDRLLLKRIAPRLFTPEMARSAAKAFPRFAGLVDIWMTQGNMDTLWEYDNSFGEAPSIWDDFVRYILQLLSTHPDYCKTVKALPTRSPAVSMYSKPLQLKDAYLQPWSIVDQAELQRLADIINIDPKKTDRYHANTQHVYSAASIALLFFSNCTKKNLASLRKVVLIEDDVSVAQSECHGRGFIPLCQENTSLHIERRVNLWKSVFSVSFDSKLDYMYGPQMYMEPDDLRDTRLLAVDVTKSVGKWIMETMELPCLGMPANSYTLVLDGEPTLGHTSNVFRIMQRDTAYQAALDDCYNNGVLPMPSWLDRRRHPGFAYQGLPDVVRTLSMTEGSLIRCNFNPGSPCDIEDMLEEHRGWSPEDWESNWSEHEPRKFQTELPLPPWHVLRWQHVLP